MLTPETVLQDRYRVLRQLGQGGMGAVYEALDQRLDTTVALKETFFADERLRKQFEREARLLARLHHPALPRVSDHFSEADGQFLVMQFIPGDDLAEMMNRKRGPFPPAQVLAWADQLLDALDYLHTQDPQIVHRDIKPQNLKLTARGQIILLDFGLAKGQHGEVSRVTTSASIFGYTPNYAPLEQIQGLGTDSRSDLYSLGATLYHLMTGIKPPDALTRAAALVNGQPDPLVNASEANAEVAPEVDQVLAKSMAQNRDQRYATAAEMRRALHGTEQGTTVGNRAEAQTVLFPPTQTAPGTPTQTAERQATAVAAGDTTIVRPRGSGPRVLPIGISAAIVLLVACGVFGIYAWRTSQQPVMRVAEPLVVPAVESPTPEVTPAPESKSGEVAEAAPTPNKTDSAPKKPKQKISRADADTDIQTHEGELPRVPIRPNFRNRRDGERRIFMGGVVIEKLPDGRQLITMPEGQKVMVDKDGKRTLLEPGRPNRRDVPQPQSPPPTPAPTP